MRDEQNPVSEAAVWIGVDVSKSTFDAALAEGGQGGCPPGVFPVVPRGSQSCCPGCARPASRRRPPAW